MPLHNDDRLGCGLILSFSCHVTSGELLDQVPRVWIQRFLLVHWDRDLRRRLLRVD